MDDDDPICYWRGECKDFLDPSPKFQWLPLTNDLSVGKCKEGHKAGMISLKLSINH